MLIPEESGDTAGRKKNI